MSVALLLIYLFAGPAAWGLLWIGTYFGQARVNRLQRWSPGAEEASPPVTVLIPAKDEGAGIGQCIDAVLRLDYPDFDVIAVDDRSADNTGAVLDQIAERDRRLKVMHIAPGGLPAGWLGKCHALFAGSREVRGQWLLFVDSDVTVEPQSLRMALSMAMQRKYDALSIFTRIECNSFLERLMLPPLAAAWVVMYTASLTNEDSRKTIAVANGQFFLIRRDVYEAVGGHEAVKDQITEDVELMRLMKARDYKVRIFMGAHLAATRMHSGLRQMFHGWSRIFSGTSRRRPGRILLAAWFLIASVFTVYPALAWGIYQSTAGEHLWLAAALLHFVLMTAYFIRVYRWSGNPIGSAGLIPISAGLMLAIYVYSLRKCRTGRITWRDTEFAAGPSPAGTHPRS